MAEYGEIVVSTSLQVERHDENCKVVVKVTAISSSVDPEGSLTLLLFVAKLSFVPDNDNKNAPSFERV